MALKSVSDCLLTDHDTYFSFPEAMKDLNRVAMAFLNRWTDKCAGIPAEKGYFLCKNVFAKQRLSLLTSGKDAVILDKPL